ncbi:hypothetical protein [Bradyrhizobium yuanmingense]|uniref:hypothetical protein n=1 Tax=Bradyrhizobium yuanmingense TaxID=108015 RepID=UPI000A6AFB4A|nr:hypothetical protein [Bradyrhizobium yuanmingense]
MKKRSEAYLAKKAAKRAASQAVRAQSPILSDSLRKDRPSWTRATKYFVGTLIVGTVGFVASVYQIAGGPPWPVAPVFVPGFPSSGHAFDVPFTVTNKSALFSLRHLEILCGFEKVKTDAKSGVQQLSITASDGKATLGPLESTSYTCPVKRMFSFAGATKFEEATISFLTKYDSHLPWGDRTQSQSDFFTLNTNTVPPQWTIGKPIR